MYTENDLFMKVFSKSRLSFESNYGFLLLKPVRWAWYREIYVSGTFRRRWRERSSVAGKVDSQHGRGSCCDTAVHNKIRHYE